MPLVLGLVSKAQSVKFYSISLILLVVLLCPARGQSPDQSQVSRPSSPLLPPHNKLQFIQSPETKERREIKTQASALFTNRDYDGLEKMVGAYRDSKAQFADGLPKLSLVYDALQPAAGDSEQVWLRYQIQLQDWIHARPDSPTPRIAMARVLASYAGNAPGNGRAYRPDDADWLLFRARLQGALKYLQEAGKLKEGCPIYWSTLQTVVLGLQVNRKQYNQLFTEAIHEFPKNQTYYNHRAIFLLPRWHGFPGEWELDLARSANTVGGETGDMLYARVVWYMHSDGGFTNIFNQAPKISWPRVDRGFEGILKESPDSLAAMSERSHLAALKGDKAKAREYFLQTKGQVDACLWDGKDAFQSNFRWMFSR
jgi:hypothetical protein